MATDNILSLIGHARKAGKLEVGEEPVGAACADGRQSLILLAADSRGKHRAPAAHFGEAGKVLWLTIRFPKPSSALPSDAHPAPWRR
jgi:hypothetical protein